MELTPVHNNFRARKNLKSRGPGLALRPTLWHQEPGLGNHHRNGNGGHHEHEGNNVHRKKDFRKQKGEHHKPNEKGKEQRKNQNLVQGLVGWPIVFRGHSELQGR